MGPTTVLKGGDVAAEVAAVKSQAGGDLLVEGSARLVHTLAQHQLVDEYRLMVFPVLLGQGKRVFPDSMPAPPSSPSPTRAPSAPASCCSTSLPH